LSETVRFFPFFFLCASLSLDSSEELSTHFNISLTNTLLGTIGVAKAAAGAAAGAVRA